MTITNDSVSWSRVYLLTKTEMEQREGNYETFITRTLATEVTKVEEKQMTMTTIVILVVYKREYVLLLLVPFLFMSDKSFIDSSLFPVFHG